jgi:glycosyltransferase involved in cell wall biosynthesis
MHVVHLLRKCDPAEWGGTETAVQRLFEGLRQHGVNSVVHCPRLAPDRGPAGAEDPLAAAGCAVRRYRAFVPVWGLSPATRQQHVAVGGNLMSFDLLRTLWREPDVSLIHTHTLGRLGGIASTVARRRGLPFVVTIHGGLLDLPQTVQAEFEATARRGFDWGRVFGLFLQSRRLLEHADAILTCNAKEAALLQEQNPRRRVHVQPHGVPLALYQPDHRAAAQAALPQIKGREVLLCVGRIDPVKNQGWLVAQAPEIFKRHPRALIVLAGGCTDEAYGQSLRETITQHGLQDRVLSIGGLPPADPRLIGLFQSAAVVVLPSLSETFGLVILEAWAAGATVLASRTSGASALIRHGENGWLFDLANPSTFHECLGWALGFPSVRRRLAATSFRQVAAEFDVTAVAGRVKRLYEQLIEDKGQHALRRTSR